MQQEDRELKKMKMKPPEPLKRNVHGGQDDLGCALVDTDMI